MGDLVGEEARRCYLIEVPLLVLEPRLHELDQLTTQ